MAKHKFNDFSGGLTDLPFNTASNYATNCDNFLIGRDKSIEVRQGFNFLDSNNPQLSTERINNIIEIDDDLVYISNGSGYFINGTVQQVSTPTSNPIFHQATPDTMSSIAQIGEQFIAVDDSYSFPMKLFRDETNTLKAITAGLPPILTDPVFSTTASNKNYVYAICYAYEYQVGTTQFLDLGEPRYIEVEDVESPDVSAITLSSIPELTNGTSRNYDLTDIKVHIYRTQSNGQTYYKIGEVDNTAGTFIDNFSDESITSGALLYTQGNVKPNELPPQAKYVAVSSNVVWYANVIESAEVKPYRLKFSKVADPDSVPVEFFEDFESEITGITSLNDRLIVFTKNKVIRLEGVLDDIGRGTIIKNTIADVGCISNASIVTTEDFAYWFSGSGVYKTDGFNHQKLTSHLDQTYQSVTLASSKNPKIYGAYDSVNQRVYWTISRSSVDNDACFIYDEIHQGFTTFSSGFDFQPGAIIFKDQSMIRGDIDGYVFQHKEDYYNDLVKDYTKIPSEWISKAIPYEWKHIAWDFGDSDRLKWIPKVSVFGRPKSNVSMEFRSYREGSDEYHRLSPIRFNPLAIWGDPNLIWGDNSIRWNSIDYLNVTKRMNRRALRATHLQLSLAPAKVKISGSSTNADSYIMVDSTTKTISLVTPALYKFTLNNEGYEVVINGKSYEILNDTIDSLVVSDDSNTLVNGVYPYEIQGYFKDQRPQISGISVTYEFFGDMDKLVEA